MRWLVTLERSGERVEVEVDAPTIDTAMELAQILEGGYVSEARALD